MKYTEQCIYYNSHLDTGTSHLAQLSHWNAFNSCCTGTAILQFKRYGHMFSDIVVIWCKSTSGLWSEHIWPLPTAFPTYFQLFKRLSSLDLFSLCSLFFALSFAITFLGLERRAEFTYSEVTYDTMQFWELIRRTNVSSTIEWTVRIIRWNRILMLGSFHPSPIPCLLLCISIWEWDVSCI